jgi:hypothetical protein
MPGSSDTVGETHLAVRGPRVNEFAVQERIARLLEAVLNAADEFALEPPLKVNMVGPRP